MSRLPRYTAHFSYVSTSVQLPGSNWEMQQPFQDFISTQLEGKRGNKLPVAIAACHPLGSSGVSCAGAYFPSHRAEADCNALCWQQLTHSSFLQSNSGIADNPLQLSCSYCKLTVTTNNCNISIKP